MMDWLVCIAPFLLRTCTSEHVCKPPEIDFGRTETNKKTEYLENDTVQYTCFPGYDVKGTDWISCQEEGWTPPPKCLAPCTITKKQMDDRNLLLFGGLSHSEMVRNEHTIVFVCKKGYLMMSPSIRKCVDGELTLPSCNSTENLCKYPQVGNGALSWSNTFYSDVYFPKKVGQKISFKCNRGFLPGNKKHWSQIICTSSGWDPEPHCYKKCIPPKHLPYGHLMYDSRNSFIEGDEITFQCDEGYNPEDSLAKATCTKNDWFPTLNCFSTVSSGWRRIFYR